jgi:hypothetical protein
MDIKLAAKRRPTGFFRRGCIEPMNCRVSVEFLTSGARGARSRFQEDTFQTQRLDAISGPHWQHPSGFSVPLLVHPHACLIEALVEQTELWELYQAHGSFKSYACATKVFGIAGLGSTP